MKIINRNSTKEVFNFKLENHIEYLNELIKYYQEGLEIAKESKINGQMINPFFSNSDVIIGKKLSVEKEILKLKKLFKV